MKAIHFKSIRQKNFSLFVLIGIMLSLILAISLINNKFITLTNMSSLLIRTCEDIIIVGGMTLVIISGNIDLSVGSVLAFVPCVMGVLHGLGVPFIWCLISGFVTGFSIGIFNSYLIAIVRVPAFIATLASMTGVRSAVYVISGGSTISTYPEGFGDISNQGFLGIKYPIIIMIVIVVSLWLYLNKTKYGRFIYAIGGNEAAAFASGIKVSFIKASVLIISALCASVAGVMLTARTATTSPNAGTQSALNAITAVLIGGASINGGTGRLGNAIIGVIILALIQNGLNLLHISSYYQLIISGAVLIIIVGFDTVRRSKRFK